jgi:hypothetical protein
MPESDSFIDYVVNNSLSTITDIYAEIGDDNYAIIPNVSCNGFRKQKGIIYTTRITIVNVADSDTKESKIIIKGIFYVGILSKGGNLFEITNIENVKGISTILKDLYNRIFNYGQQKYGLDSQVISDALYEELAADLLISNGSKL